MFWTEVRLALFRQTMRHQVFVAMLVCMAHTQLQREPNMIDKGFYITDYTGARNKSALKKLGVTHILSAVGFSPAFPDEFKYKVLHIDDSDSEVCA